MVENIGEKGNWSCSLHILYLNDNNKDKRFKLKKQNKTTIRGLARWLSPYVRLFPLAWEAEVAHGGRDTTPASYLTATQAHHK